MLLHPGLWCSLEQNVETLEEWWNCPCPCGSGCDHAGPCDRIHTRTVHSPTAIARLLAVT